MSLHAEALSPNEPNPARQFRYAAPLRQRIANFFDVTSTDPSRIYSAVELARELGVSVELITGVVDDVACPDGQIPRKEAEVMAREVLPASLLEEALADDSRAFSIPMLERPVFVTIPLPRRIIREAQGRYASRPASMESHSFEDWLGVQVDFHLGTSVPLDFSQLSPQEAALFALPLERCATA